MLDNPFRERAIAARANRQQLDRLLRVTAPHERIALVAVGLILVGIGAWVAFGGQFSPIMLLGFGSA